jgi:hypothetical protein
MNGRLKLGTTAFLLLLSQFNNVNAGGPYDGEWTDTATPTVNDANEPLSTSP